MGLISDLDFVAREKIPLPLGIKLQLSSLCPLSLVTMPSWLKDLGDLKVCMVEIKFPVYFG
jgi:hypothetical protein